MKNKLEIYSTEEQELFQALEAEVDSEEYQPLSSEVLEKEKTFYQQVAVDTVAQKNTQKIIKY